MEPSVPYTENVLSNSHGVFFNSAGSQGVGRSASCGRAHDPFTTGTGPDLAHHTAHLVLVSREKNMENYVFFHVFYVFFQRYNFPMFF